MFNLRLWKSITISLIIFSAYSLRSFSFSPNNLAGIRFGRKCRSRWFSIEVSNSNSHWLPPPIDPSIIPPFDQIIGYNIETRSVIFESSLGRQLGIDIVQGDNNAIVGDVVEGSKAETFGILKGDVIVATSATAGDQMWSHSSAESIKAALSTRFVMSSTVQIRFERPLAAISAAQIEKIKVRTCCTQIYTYCSITTQINVPCVSIKTSRCQRICHWQRSFCN